MQKIFHQTTVSPGQGTIVVKAVASNSTIYKLSSAYPVKLISPRSPYDRRAVLVFMLSYGGGLVPGDRVDVSAHVHGNSRLGLLTQGTTKVFKSVTTGATSRQNLTVTVEDGAALLVLPDPVQPFKDSIYEQQQTFNMQNNSSILMLDWISEGRRTMDQVWSFNSLISRNELWGPETTAEVAGKTTVDAEKGPKASRRRLLLRDNLLLKGACPVFPGGLRHSMDSLGIVGTLIIGGPVFKCLGDFFCKEFEREPRIGNKRWAREDAKRPPAYPGLIWTATFTRGFTIVKFGAKEVDQARRWLREMLTREGTVEREFGKRFLLCLQDR